MLTIEVYKSGSFLEYEKIIKDFGLQLDIYYTPSLLEIEAKYLGAECEIFVAYNQNGHIFIYPYIKARISVLGFENYFDIFSPYGYAGPYSNSQEFFYEAEEYWVNYVSNLPMVNEFIRYHYLFNKSERFKINCKNLKNRTIVLGNCDSGNFEQYWEKKFSKTNRNLVRKLEKEGFNFEITSDNKVFNEFVKMYYSTMDKAGASSNYYFSENYFKELRESLGDKLILARVYKDNITYASALFFLSFPFVTYYLSARNLSFPKIPASNLLLSYMVKWTFDNNFHYLNFGGGLKDDVNDPLFKFKTNFSSDTLDFYIGKRIHNLPVYQEIIDEWTKQNGKDAFEVRKMILQFYRN